MGQHKRNPTAIAYAAGDIRKEDRAERPRQQGSRFGGPPPHRHYYTDKHGSIRRRVPKVKGKSDIRRVKRERRLRREARLRAAAVTS